MSHFKRRRCKRKHHFSMPSSYFNVEVVHISIFLFLSFHLRHSYELAITGKFRYRQRNDAAQGKVLFCLYHVLSHFGYKFIPYISRFNICRNLFPYVSVFRTFFVISGSSLRGKRESGGSPPLSFTLRVFCPLSRTFQHSQTIHCFSAYLLTGFFLISKARYFVSKISGNSL